MDSKIPQDVNGTPGGSTSDGIHRPNGMTREQWLHAVLYSGRVSKVGQHLALVLYHLADTATNIAKLSARDLERITGWGRTVIIERLNELHDLGEYLKVTWGQGRAKSIFELQGIIAETIAQQRVAERTVRLADAMADATAATTDCVREADDKTATTADTTVVVNQAVTTPDTTSCVRLADTTMPDSVREADTTAATTPPSPLKEKVSPTPPLKENNPSPPIHTLSAHAREKTAPPDWMVSEDGGFEGKVFELSGVEVGALQTTYGYLDFPADLLAVDQFMARQFDKLGARPPTKECLARMHAYLAKRNRETREMHLRMGLIEKPARKAHEPAQPVEQPSCWFDDDAKLQVANGFKVELLEVVGGDEAKLRAALNEAGGWVGVQVRGPQLIAKVRSQIAKQVKGEISTRGTSQLSRRERIRGYVEETQAKLRADRQRGSERS